MPTPFSPEQTDPAIEEIRPPTRLQTLAQALSRFGKGFKADAPSGAAFGGLIGAGVGAGTIASGHLRGDPSLQGVAGIAPSLGILALATGVGAGIGGLSDGFIGGIREMQAPEPDADPLENEADSRFQNSIERIAQDPSQIFPLLNSINKTAAYELVFYANRSTPQILRTDRKEEPRPKAGYGEVTHRRAASKEENDEIEKGKWLRVDEKGNRPSSPEYKKTTYRPQLVKAAPLSNPLNSMTTQNKTASLVEGYFTELGIQSQKLAFDPYVPTPLESAVAPTGVVGNSNVPRPRAALSPASQARVDKRKGLAPAKPLAPAPVTPIAPAPVKPAAAAPIPGAPVKPITPQPPQMKKTASLVEGYFAALNSELQKRAAIDPRLVGGLIGAGATGAGTLAYNSMAGDEIDPETGEPRSKFRNIVRNMLLGGGAGVLAGHLSSGSDSAAPAGLAEAAHNPMNLVKNDVFAPTTVKSMTHGINPVTEPKFDLTDERAIKADLPFPPDPSKLMRGLHQFSQTTPPPAPAPGPFSSINLPEGEVLAPGLSGQSDVAFPLPQEPKVNLRSDQPLKMGLNYPQGDPRVLNQAPLFAKSASVHVDFYFEELQKRAAVSAPEVPAKEAPTAPAPVKSLWSRIARVAKFGAGGALIGGAIGAGAGGIAGAKADPLALLNVSEVEKALTRALIPSSDLAANSAFNTGAGAAGGVGAGVALGAAAGIGGALLTD